MNLFNIHLLYQHVGEPLLDCALECRAQSLLYIVKGPYPPLLRKTATVQRISLCMISLRQLFSFCLFSIFFFDFYLGSSVVGFFNTYI